MTPTLQGAADWEPSLLESCTPGCASSEDITPSRDGRELQYLDSSFQRHQVQNMYGSERVDLTDPS